MSGAGLEPAGRLRSDVLIKSKTMLTSPSLVPIHIKLSGIMPPFLWGGGSCSFLYTIRIWNTTVSSCSHPELSLTTGMGYYLVSSFSEAKFKRLPCGLNNMPITVLAVGAYNFQHHKHSVPTCRDTFTCILVHIAYIGGYICTLLHTHMLLHTYEKHTVAG